MQTLDTILALVTDPNVARGANPKLLYMTEQRFDATISSNAITLPADGKASTGYYYHLLGVRGHIEEPGLQVVNQNNVLWNIDRPGQRAVFDTDQVMSDLLTIFGPLPPVRYPFPLWRFNPNEIFSVRFAMRSGTTWSGAASRIVGVTLEFCATHPSITANP